MTKWVVTRESDDGDWRYLRIETDDPRDDWVATLGWRIDASPSEIADVVEVSLADAPAERRQDTETLKAKVRAALRADGHRGGG